MNPLCKDPDFLALGVPEEAFPTASACRGKMSYTRQGPKGCKIEVHYKGKTLQYFVKEPVKGAMRPISPNVNWKRHGGPVAAWAEAKRLAGWS